MRNFSAQQIEEIIDLAMQDSVPFEKISAQFQLTADEIVSIMRTHLKLKSYVRWKERRGLASFRKHSAVEPDIFRVITTPIGRRQHKKIDKKIKQRTKIAFKRSEI
jgi:uncharacterized protein (TIGR03643 family)